MSAPSPGSATQDHRRHMVTAPVREGYVQSALLSLFDAAVAISVLIVPLTMAGIREYGIGLFVCCSCVMAVIWSVRQLLTSASWSPTGPAAMIGIAAIGLVWLQLQPLPDGLLQQLSPFKSRYLTLWGTEAGQVLGHADWTQISMTPEATRSGLVLLIAYVLFFLTLTQRLNTQQEIDRLIKMSGVSAIIMAAVGIGQIMVGDGRFLFVIEHPTRSAAFPAKGTFTNQNHFAHFMALGIGPLLWWWQSLLPDSDHEDNPRSGRRRDGRSRRRSASVRLPQTDDRRVLLYIGSGTALVFLGAILSVSRGGVLAFAIASTVAMCAVIRNPVAALKLVIPVGVFLAAVLVAFGADELIERWDRIAGAESLSDLSHGRWALWTALAQAIPEFWPAGSGVGSHADVYPIWLSEQFDVRFSHAECGYLQILLETGVPGIILLAAAILLCGFWCLNGWRRGDREQRRRITALAGVLLASLVHSVFDFVWYIPGCMILTLTILVCLCRSSQLTAPAAGTVVPGTPRIPTLIAAVVLVLILPTARVFADAVHRDTTSAHYWNDYRSRILSIGEGTGDSVESLNEQLDLLIAQLEHCLQNDPFHHSAWSALAPLYLHRFEQHSSNGDNQMSLQDIRDTIRQAEFASQQEAMEWLERAFGDDIHDLHRAVHTARQALRHRPLASEAYLVLSETAFLTAAPPDVLAAVVNQAIRLRPHKPRVLYAAGLLAEESGETESAWSTWRHAAGLDVQIAGLIIDRFVNRIPATELIERLEPNRQVYFRLFDAYRRNRLPEDQRTVAVAFATSFDEIIEQVPEEDANAWKQCAQLLSAADQEEQAGRCLRRAVRQTPEDLGARRRYAVILSNQGQLREARRELTWLAARMPQDQEIAVLLDDVTSRYKAEDLHRRPERSDRQDNRIRRISHVSRESVPTRITNAAEQSAAALTAPVGAPWPDSASSRPHGNHTGPVVFQDAAGRMTTHAAAVPPRQQHATESPRMRMNHAQ